ncbi:hypothetical protein QA640_17175 [Bradyrhizobium sp. CB82]|uniref:hypothetical protein n=1 Tax=Bradyrhizobium sp. CB82 TaxID=3039159 RepID=UPI0024B0BEC1|nr:hypothetical protein [Bradyrhizobium sp. CB82]WFU44022.1 hypothetical protein QA640_17175 [Bradyrhizobium sp. CB82]
MSEKPNRPTIIAFMIVITFALLAAHVDGQFTANATTPQGGDCRDLRRACEMKDELGEGEDNCVKFRKVCSPSTPHVNCEWLRDACMYREELGIEGNNNCGRYRDNCHDGTIKEEQ